MIDPAAFRRAFPADAALSTWCAPDGWRHRRLDWPAARGRSGAQPGRLLFQAGRAGRESAHEVLREVDPVRTRALAAIDRFLDRHAA